MATAIDDASALATPPAPEVRERASGYSWYVLAVLFLIYAANFLDRQALSILADDVKRDLHLGDAQLGFLYGTAFAIFYALFSLPLARMADAWLRGRLMAIGLALWSLMTAASGLATSFPALAAARTTVGIGEASAAPAAFSMLADYFPPRQRAFVASIYTAGAYLGGGLALPFGGLVATRWDKGFARPPLGLHGWQVTFLAIGLIGVVLTLWILSVREPQRGRFDGLPSAAVRPDAWRGFAQDVMAIVPPFTLLVALRHRADAIRVLAVAAGIAVLAALLIWLTGDVAQWVVLGIGVHAVHAWTLSLKRADRPTWALTCGSPTAMLTLLGIGLITFIGCAFGFWMTPLAVRHYGLDKETVGIALGLPTAAASVLGIIVGGWLSDRWKQRDPRGRVWVLMLATGLPAPLMAAMCLVPDFATFRLLAPLSTLFGAMWAGSAVTLMQDQVLPRMRGTVSAGYLLSANMIGLGLGPYFTGKLAEATGSLVVALLVTLIVVPITLLVFGAVAWTISGREADMVDRARAAGEPI